MTAPVDVVIVGAGAAGLAAARRLAEAGVSFQLLEASHRIGGRAHTEYLPDGSPFDLGCHWLHSASINPFVPVADEFGFRYQQRTDYGRVAFFRNGQWLSEDVNRTFEADAAAREQTIRSAWSVGRDISVADATDRDGQWVDVLDYYTAQNTSSDPDQVSVGDIVNYHDTGENWPLPDGYGALVERWAFGIPAVLNTVVKTVRWDSHGVRVETSRGIITAQCAVIAVSTGVLGSGELRFIPELPVDKQSAVAALPLGNYNHILLSIRKQFFDPDIPDRVVITSEDDSPIGLTLFPYEFDCVIGIVAGRFADWLERVGAEASRQVITEALGDLFGHDIVRYVTADRQSAWRGNPFVRGAYSSAAPGEFHQRSVLAQPLADRLYFCGEATSTDHFCTCHGAKITGERAAGEVLESLAGTSSKAAPVGQ